MATLAKVLITSIQEEILTWYAKHQRDLPWRRDREPYHILVSEIMLQQTQVHRVIPKYEAWLETFPTVETLAKAKTADVLRLWSGLGYNRRALYLQKTAQALVQMLASRMRGSTSLEQVENDGVLWPRTVAGLKKLPGIGEYTAAAIACFAFDQQIAVVDTNVRRVILLRLLNKYEIRNPKSETNPKDKNTINQNVLKLRNSNLEFVSSFDIRASDFGMVTQNQIQEIADQLLPVGRAYEWNQALMDYASAMLKQEKIPIKKQSTFKGSNRYYRGQTVKLLLEHKGASIKYLGEMLGKDEVFIERLVQELEKDGLVKRKKKQVHLA
jgi:A/G-specific adenine glycosylase